MEAVYITRCFALGLEERRYDVLEVLDPVQVDGPPPADDCT